MAPHVPGHVYLRGVPPNGIDQGTLAIWGLRYPLKGNEMDITLRSDMLVEVLDVMGDDWTILQDARESLRSARKTGSDPNRDQGLETEATNDRPRSQLTDRDRRLLRDFFRLGHASTLRGCILKVRLEVPIFIQREIRTHWVGMKQHWVEAEESDWLGFNDQSGRYRTYRPIFWVPKPSRPFQEADGFTPMQPAFIHPGPDAYEHLIQQMIHSYHVAWTAYQRLLASGVAREVARSLMPEGTYVSGRITANLNAWFGFIAVRTKHPASIRPSFPQREIEDVASQIEAAIERYWPEAYQAWLEGGRCRP